MQPERSNSALEIGSKFVLGDNKIYNKSSENKTRKLKKVNQDSKSLGKQLLNDSNLAASKFH